MLLVLDRDSIEFSEYKVTTRYAANKYNEMHTSLNIYLTLSCM